MDGGDNGFSFAIHEYLRVSGGTSMKTAKLRTYFIWFFILAGALQLLYIFHSWRSSLPLTWMDLSRTNSEDKDLGGFRVSEKGLTKGVDTLPNTLYIGVFTAEKYLRTRADACLNTWVNRLPPKDVEFFIGVKNVSESKKWKGNLVNLEGFEDVYPPLEKLFRMFQYICSHHLHNYDWFMKADDDTYIKTEKLVNFLNTLDKDKVIYLGQFGRGRKEERDSLGLEGRGYCMGGPGFILSRPAMIEICPHLEECLKSAVSGNDDAELGRCATRHLGIECTGIQGNKLFHQVYPYNSSISVYGGDLRNDRDFKAALTLHPAKEPELMYNLHGHYLRSLREESSNSSYDRG